MIIERRNIFFDAIQPLCSLSSLIDLLIAVFSTHALLFAGLLFTLDTLLSPDKLMSVPPLLAVLSLMSLAALTCAVDVGGVDWLLVTHDSFLCCRGPEPV